MSATMQYIVVICIYFSAMLLTGVLFNKKIKSDSDYFIARDQIGAPAIGFSFSATQMSGSTYLSTVGNIRSLGYSFVPAALSSAAAPWFCYVLVGDRVRRISSRLKSVTMGDIFEARYGKAAGLIASIIMIIASLPTIAAQLKAAGGSFELLIGIPYVAAIFVFGGIVVLYTLLGGMFAVAVTDLVQGILMIIGLVILLPIVFAQCGGWTALQTGFAAMNPAGAGFTTGQPLMWVISGFLVWGFFQIGGQPAAVTRFMTTSDNKKLKQALVYSIIFESIIFLFVTLIALASGTLITDSGIAPDMVLPALIDMYLPPVVGGVVLSAALGAMMSTVDSVLLMVSSIFVNNIYEKFSKNVDHKKGLFYGRIITIVIGIGGLLIAIDPPDAVLWIITMGFSLMAGAFTFPLLLGLWWENATNAGGVAGIVCGGLSTVAWYLLSYAQYQSLSTYVGGIWPAIVGAIVSLVVTIAVSKCTKASPAEVKEVFFNDIEE